jgi:UDP-N-acetylglucosamine pyrophosphorylase
VWVLEEGKFPIFSIPSDESGSKILFKSSYELLEAPVGPGGVLSLLSFQKILDAFNQMGIEYVQVVCKLFIL